MFRWKGLIFLAALLGLFLVLSLIFTDDWLEGNLESLGASIVGARVDIDDLDLSLAGMRVGWKRLQITHPKHTMRNMIETESCEFDLEFWPLLSKKVIIEDFRITGIQTFTKRETDGKLPEAQRRRQTESPGFISRTTQQLSERVKGNMDQRLFQVKGKLNVDSLMRVFDIRSVDQIDSLQKALTGKYESWNGTLKQLNITEKTKEIERQVQSIKVDKIDNIEKLQSTLEKSERLRKNIESINDEFKNTKKRLLTDVDQAKTSLNQVDNWIQNDYRRAMAKAKLPDISAGNIGAMLFGGALVDRFNLYLGYAGQARELTAKLKSAQPKKEQPPRFEGQDIYFFNRNARPDFWIKELELSGKTADQLALDGNIKHLVSDQRFIMQPTQINVTASKEQGPLLAFSGIIDHLQEIPKENFTLTYQNFSMAGRRISDSPLLPQSIKNGRGSLEATLTLIGEEVQSKIGFKADRLDFDFKKAAENLNTVERIMQNTIRGLDQLQITANIKQKADDLHFAIKSNVDKLFAQNLKASISGEIERAKQRIKKQIDEQVVKHKAQLQAVVAEREKKLRAQIEEYQAMIREHEAKVEAKKQELKERIEKEKKKMGDEVEDRLKDLFK